MPRLNRFNQQGAFVFVFFQSYLCFYFLPPFLAAYFPLVLFHGLSQMTLVWMFPRRSLQSWACTHNADYDTQQNSNLINSHVKPTHLSFPLSCPSLSILPSHGWHCTVTGPPGGTSPSALQASSFSFLPPVAPTLGFVCSSWVTDFILASFSVTTMHVCVCNLQFKIYEHNLTNKSNNGIWTSCICNSKLSFEELRIHN